MATRSWIGWGLVTGLLTACTPAVAGPLGRSPVQAQTAASAPAWRTPLATMRALAATVNTPASDTLWPRLSEAMQRVVGTAAGLRQAGRYFAEHYGPEVALDGERIAPANGQWVYVRRAQRGQASTVVETVVAAQDDGAITSLSVTPAQPFPTAAASANLAYRTKTALRLPFDDEWYVLWGGRSVAQNYHAEAPDQRFAYDLVIVRQATTHTGDGTRNTDYFCYGKPVLAPGAGTVVSVVDRFPDNRPGTTNPADHAGGNHVILDHGNGEFSVLCHLQPGSLAVTPGQTVRAGDRIGLTGNSGHSSEPHLHYHLQTTGTFFKGAGLPVQFVDYRAADAPVPRGEPVQGQFIRPATP